MNSNNMYNFELANQMGTFFVQKIESIGSKLDNNGTGATIPYWWPHPSITSPAQQIQPPFRGGGSLT